MLLALLSSQAFGGYSVAILKDDANYKTKAIADSISPVLTQNGFAADFITYQTLCDTNGLDKYDCLILTDSSRFPALANQNLLAFLKRGSDMVLLGGMAFKEDLWPMGNKWGTMRQLLQNIKDPNNVASRKMLFDFEDDKFTGWERGATKKEHPTLLLSDKGVDGNCMKMDIKNIADYEWDNFTNLAPENIPANHNAFVFYARATQQTKNLIFEVIKKDKSRWITSVELTPDWRQYVVMLEDFKFFLSASGDKQKTSELNNIADINQISLGLAYGIMPHISGDHTIWLDQLATGVLKLPDGDNKDTKPLGLPVFDARDIYHFQNAPTMVAYKNQDILNHGQKTIGSYTGISAIAFEYPEISRYIPLLQIQDKYSRSEGFAAGILVNYAGEFKNSHWLLFGIESPEFYATKEFVDTTVKALNRFKQNNLPEKLANEDRINKNARLDITSPAPDVFIRLSEDGKHFILPNGKKFFTLGCNYIGPFERKCELGEDYFNLQRLEEDFKKAKDAGINTFRFWNFRMENHPDRLKTVIELARKYQIYLLLQPREHPLPTDKQHMEVFEKTAKIAAAETIVLGYDLMNEPYVTVIGSTTVNGKPSKILEHKAYERYSSPKFFDKLWVDQTAAEKAGYPEVGSWISPQDRKNLYAANAVLQQYMEKYTSKQDYSCLYGFDGKLPIEPNHKEIISILDESVRDWILFHKEAIKKFDNNHFITVGYNTSLAAMPANALLDFTSHHIYQMPYSYQDVQKSITTFDRLRAFWPNKPITIGEFGFSAGLKMPDDTYLGINAASVAEMAVYLYAFANDYSGAYLWMLSEWPLANMKYNAPWISPEKQIYESRFGMFYYDGTPQGSPKPIAYAAKFFREYIDTHSPGDGEFKLVFADTPTGAGFVFTDKDALFIGDTKYNSERLKFNSPVPVNVMLMWNVKQLKIMATADIDAAVDLSKFGFADISNLDVKGNYDAYVRTADNVKLKLLKGQTVIFLMEKE